jgi:hypothetical protein
MEKYLISSKMKPLYFLCGIWVIALIFRLFYYDETIPLSLDGLNFFSYSADIHTIGKLPTNYDVAKPGWSYVLALIFSAFNFEQTMQYMQLQKLSSIIISSLSIFPLFFLIKKFTTSKYSLLGVLLFAVEPRIIQNTISGNSESLFIFLIIGTILLFLNKDNRLIYLSFLLAGIATMIRPEGLFLFIGISISYIIRFRKQKFVIPKYVLALFLFMLILAPIIIHKQQEGMYDSVFERAYFTLMNNDDYDKQSREILDKQLDQTHSQGKKSNILITSTEYFLKYLVWVLIPLFILVTPIGFIIFFKNFNMEKLTILILTIVMAIPALYAYTFPLLETKYLYFLFPMFCIFATFSLKLFIEKFKKKNLVFLICFSLIILSSIFFIDYKFDYQKEHESVIIADYVVKNTKIINNYYPESIHIAGIDIENEWKDYKIFYENTDRILYQSSHHPRQVILFEPNYYDTLESFLRDPQRENITHLVLDGKNTRPEFLNDIFYNENKYPFLNKIYDSTDLDFKYHVKIFEVN